MHQHANTGVRSQGSPAVKRFAPSAITVVLLLALWEVAAVTLKAPAYVLPAPTAVVKQLLSPSWNWLSQAKTTSLEILGGFALAGILGVFLGIVVSWSNRLRDAVLPILVVVNSMPKIAMAPLFIIWLGYGIVPNMWIAFLVAFFPITLNTSAGLNDIDPDLIDLARSLRTPKWRVFLHVRLPNALPYIFSGLKIGSTQAVIGAVVGEFIASTNGLASLIMSAQASLATGAIIGALLWIAALAGLLYGAVSLLQTRVMPWDNR